MNPLVWSPVFKILEEQIRGGDDLILIIVPFAKVGALKQLHWVQDAKKKMKLICRWTPEDLIAGVSDVEVFTYLKEKGCELYINPIIHLKLYIFDSNIAFNTSGNLTLRGLGYSEHPNIEVGNMVRLTPTDWTQIYRIIGASRQVDDMLYQRFKEYIGNRPNIPPSNLPADLFSTRKAYTISSLPATETPEKLAEYFRDPSADQYSPDEIRRAAHDLVAFGISSMADSSTFDMELGNAFRNTPFVIDFVRFLKAERTLRFGSVNAWIHQKCEDVPLPYRWELKDSTRILYNWLSYYFKPDITWDVPGQWSQVIYWMKQS